MTETTDSSAYVHFFLRGKNLDPDEITRILGIVPSRKFKRGDQYGKKKTSIRKIGFWGISSNSQCQSSELEQHFEWLLDQLETKAEQLKSIISSSDEAIDARIICVFLLLDREWGIELSPGILKRIAALNITFEISLYCLVDVGVDKSPDNDKG